MSTPEDPSESDAERVADHVLARTASPEPAPLPLPDSLPLLPGMCGSRSIDPAKKKAATASLADSWTSVASVVERAGFVDRAPPSECFGAARLDCAASPLFSRVQAAPPAHDATVPNMSWSTPASAASVGDQGRIDAAVRVPLEKRFGTSFSDVRIHADADATQRTAQIGTRAFTHGRDIYFATGHYRPETASGQKLLVHELTHVVQQRNGRFPVSSVGNQMASCRVELEREADQAAESVGPIEVRERSDGGEIHGDTNSALMAVVRGGIDAAADWVLSTAEATTNALLGQLNAARRQLASVSRLVLSPENVARLAVIYEEAKRSAPFWLPVPNIDFSGGATQQAAVVAIPAGAILLLLALLIVLIWLIGNLDPAARRARERAAEEVIEKVREALRPRPLPVPDEGTQPRPQPEPRPQPQQPRLGPDIVNPIPDLPRPRRPGAYPIVWSLALPPPPISAFVRTKSERDEDETKQARMEMDWRAFRDPAFDPALFHVHHVVPLFLGGIDDLRANGILWLKRLHLSGHQRLRWQPQMVAPPPPLLPLPVDLYEHPPGIPYELVNFKA